MAAKTSPHWIVTLAILLHAAVAGASPPRDWIMSAAVGGSVPHIRTGERPLLVGTTVSREIWRHLSLEASLRTILGEMRTQVDTTVCAGWRVPLRSVALVPGMGAGWAAIHADRGLEGSLWVHALLLRTFVHFEWFPWSQVRLGLRLTVVSWSFYFNQVWIIAWEPSGGIALSF